MRFDWVDEVDITDALYIQEVRGKEAERTLEASSSVKIRYDCSLRLSASTGEYKELNWLIDFSSSKTIVNLLLLCFRLTVKP